MLCYPNSCMLCSVLQLCPTLCDSVDCSPPGSSVRGILQARILEWVAMPSSRGSSRPRDGTHVSYISCIGRWILYHYWHLGSPPIQIQGLLKWVYFYMFTTLSPLLAGHLELHFTRGIHLTLRNSLHWQSIPWVSFLLTSLYLLLPKQRKSASELPTEPSATRNGW